MNINEIQPNKGNIDIIATLIEKQSPRTFEKFGKSGRVCNAKLQDESGVISLTLWNDDIDTVNQGDKIHLTNGWCSEFRAEKQLSAGKFGKIEIIEKASIPSTHSSASSATPSNIPVPQSNIPLPPQKRIIAKDDEYEVIKNEEFVD